jgi:methylglyoxal reductase
VYRNLTPKSIRNDLELSLKAMGTDYIDVLYTHWQCREYGLVPVDETMSELIRMKKEGKIRAIGASNVNLQVLRDYAASGELDVIQEKLSILDRKPESDLLPFCEEHGISLQTYSPIEQGLLSGKIPDDYACAPGNVREGKLWWKHENIPGVNAMLRGWTDLTEKYECSLTNLCIKWNSMLSPSVHVLCGARRIPKIEDVAKSLEIPMSRDDFERMKTDADMLIAQTCQGK